MTKQEYFGLLVETSRAGGFPSAVPDDESEGGAFCLYRGPDGRRCAVGLLIPDDRYTPRMEDLGAGQLLQEFPALGAAVPAGLTGPDLEAVQAVHDAFARDGGPWPHDRFVARLRLLSFFADAPPEA